MQQLGLPGRNSRKTGRRRLTAVFFLAVSVTMILFSFYGAQASVFEKARETVVEAAEPVLNLFNVPIRFINNRLGNISDYFRVLDQNEQLRRENDELRAWMNEAIELRRQVAYFEQVLDVQEASEEVIVDARIVGESGGPFQRSMILNAGRRDGVEKGDAVIDDRGMLGHVVTAGRGASRVLLLTDFSSRIPVYVEGAEVEAILAGRYTDLPELKFLASREIGQIAAGQRVVTAGTGGSLPRGLPVGTVEEASPAGITVMLYSDYASTDYVRVVNYAFSSDSPDEPAESEAEDTGAAEASDG